MNRPSLKLIPYFLVFASSSSVFATTYDYDGDGIADVAVRRASTYYWYVKNTGDDNFNSERQDGIQRTQFGKQETDIPIAADFDGDGITDFAVRRESNFTWYVLNSSGDNTNSERGDGIQREVFGKQAGDIPLAADFDGDGIDDFVIRRESNYTWYIKNSSGSNFNSEREDGIQRIEFGKQVGDIPVVGYFDEDNIADVAVYRSSNTTWYVKNSSGSNYNSEREDGIQRIEIGQDGDIPVPADYDGDGITDVAVRRPSTFEWIIIESGSGETVTQTFGRNEEDIPVPADYDGDGKADIAVRRSSNQTFYVLNSSGSNFNSDREDGIQRINFGRQEDDIPVNAPITEIIAKLNSVNAVDDSNSAPVADAGSDQTVEQGATVTLDGSNSTDADNDTLSYSWSFSSTPENSSATLSNSTSASPTFIADEVGEYIVALTVNDGTEESNADSVTITAVASMSNTPPVANAGADQSVSVGAQVTLDGSGSSDADDDNLNYVWEMTTSPENSNSSLNGSTTVNPNFTPDIAGTYEFSLVVNDGKDSSSPDMVSVSATNTNVDITNVEFSNRSGDCANYAGTYFSNVTDVQNSREFMGDVTITSDNSKCYFDVNEIPNHNFHETGRFATDVSEQDGDYEVPRNPTDTQSVTTLSLSLTNAITLNGVVIDLLAAACYGVGNEPLGEEKIGCGDENIDNPWRYDPMSPLNNFGTDSNNAHSQPDGTYHYHGDPVAMYDVDCESTEVASPVIGFAADGFPVYGPCFDDNGSIRKAESSFVLKNNGGRRQDVEGYTTPEEGVGVIASRNHDGQFTGDWEYSEGAGDLDECNGMTINGQYGYYVTDSHPWILKCYKGTPDNSFRKGGNALKNLLHRHEPNGKYHSH